MQRYFTEWLIVTAKLKTVIKWKGLLSAEWFDHNALLNYNRKYIWVHLRDTKVFAEEKKTVNVVVYLNIRKLQAC